MSAPLPHDPEPGGKLVFWCPECGMKLSVSSRLAGVGGPCPSCTAVISAPAVSSVTESVDQIAGTIAPPAMTTRQSKSSASRMSKGRVSADSNLDYEHMDRRENLKTLWIFLMFVLVICSCLFVWWILAVWMGK